jgi:hypothetical protein
MNDGGLSTQALVARLIAILIFVTRVTLWEKAVPTIPQATPTIRPSIKRKKNLLTRNPKVYFFFSVFMITSKHKNTATP